MARLFGIVPLGIGFSVLIFAWSDDFGGPFGVPIFFRLFPSFIALGFIMAGGAILLGLKQSPRSGLIQHALDLRQQFEQEVRVRGMKPATDEETDHSPRMTSEGYVCPSCNAPIGGQSDVSPHGDVKCVHCGRWFNIHG